MTADRRLWLGLIVGLGLLVHGWILAENLGGNPLARVLVVDAEVYWEQAGSIAQGELVGETPYFSAPLYPHLLGLLRALGGGVPAVYLVQLLLHVGTALLLARVGARRFDPPTGLAAAALWLLLTGPAYYHGRVLACTLQAFLVALLLERCVALGRGASTARLAGLGTVLGLTCLAWPPALAAAVVLGAWVFVVTGRGWGGARRAAGVVALAGVVVAPATVHNVLASGELIPISAHAGITFYHGNNQAADGTFSPLGVTNDKHVYHLEAREQARAALGPEAGWRDTSGYFLHKGLAWWRANPRRAAGLAAKKAWLYLSGRVYGDMYLPALEREDGLASRLALAPFPVAWWTLPAALAALLLLGREPRRFLPEALLVALPALVCTVFWYTPRYRMPGTPVLALLGAWSLLQLRHWRTARLRTGALAAALALSIAGGAINHRAGIDRAEDLRAAHDQRLDEVYGTYVRGLKSLGRHAAAVAAVRRMIALRPDHSAAKLMLAWTLATCPDPEVRDGPEALALARELERTSAGRDPAVLDTLAAALAQGGEFERAVEVGSRAASLWRQIGNGAEADAVDRRVELYGQGLPYRERR